MKSTSEILSLLRRYKPTAQKKYGMTKLGVFGSVARGEQKPGSDVDICYEGKAPLVAYFGFDQDRIRTAP